MGRLVRFVSLCTAMLVAVAANAQAPRAVFFTEHTYPLVDGSVDADEWATARPIFADSKTAITGVEQATSDLDDLIMTCSSDMIGKHAVAFEFYNPTNSWIQLDTSGSYYDVGGPNFTHDTVMALYDSNNTQVACNDDAGPGLGSSFIYGYFPPGLYRVQVANESGSAATGASTVVLEYELSVQGLSVMPGDKFSEATELNLGGEGSIVIHNWGYNDSSMATLPEGCFDGSSVAANRLGSRDYWYTFTLTEKAIVTLDPDGSLDATSSPLDTVLSVHKAGQPDTAEYTVLHDCIDNSQVDTQPALMVDLDAGKYYVRLAAANPLATSGSYAYVLKALVNPVRNGGFEDGNPLRAVDPAPWVFKNATGDKIDCDLLLPYDGNCVLRLKGSAGEAFSASQNLRVGDIDFSASTQVSLSVWFNTTSDAALVTARLKLKFGAGGGTSVLIVQDGSSGGSWVERSATGVTILNAADISGAKLVIKNKSAGGKVYLDNVAVMFGVVSPVPRGPQALPLPPAAQQ